MPAEPLQGHVNVDIVFGRDRITAHLPPCYRLEIPVAVETHISPSSILRRNGERRRRRRSFLRHRNGQMVGMKMRTEFLSFRVRPQLRASRSCWPIRAMGCLPEVAC